MKAEILSAKAREDFKHLRFMLTYTVLKFYCAQSKFKAPQIWIYQNHTSYLQK